MGKKVMCFNKTYPIFTCEIEDNASITMLYDVIDETHMPIMLQDGGFTIENVNKWAMQRKIPETREGLAEARQSFRGFEYYHNMFSLSDQYWFQFTQKENWKKLNFFTNTYQHETGKIFLKPWEVDSKLLKEANPDLTTNGVLKKRWIQQDNGISYLVKAGSKKYNQNPISEVLTTMFLEKLNIIPFVRYELVVDGLKICSKCQNFIDANTEFVPVSQVYYKKERKRDRETVYDHIVTQSVAYGLNEQYVKKYLDTMIAADYVIHNSDRHLNNFGYIREVSSGRLLGFAPLFDSGSAFTSSSNRLKAETMFKNNQKKALKKTFEALGMENFSEEPMMNLVAAFPTLTKEEKLEIRKQVTESAEMIRRGGKKITPKELENELPR